MIWLVELFSVTNPYGMIITAISCAGGWLFAYAIWATAIQRSGDPNDDRAN